jgi:hypothetical protein
MKTEVYSWRVSTELKAGLEREARRRKTSVSMVLDQAAREWLSRAMTGGGEDEQRRLHEAAAKCFGAFAGGDAYRSRNARTAVRERLNTRRDR